MLQHAEIAVFVLLRNRALAQIGFKKVGADQVGTAHRSATHVGPPQGGGRQVGPAQIRAEEAGGIELGRLQIGFFQDGAGEIGVGQVAARQVQARQVAEGKNRAGPPYTPRVEHFVAGGGGAHIFLGELGKAGGSGLGQACKFQLLMLIHA